MMVKWFKSMTRYECRTKFHGEQDENENGKQRCPRALTSAWSDWQHLFDGARSRA
jgi:hypothetical protein